MHILPKKVDIDKAKASERKMQIDEGVKLAAKIDMLREASLKEEKQLFEWRENNINKVKTEIAQFLEERDNLEKQNNEARKLRNKLLEPLDKEWAEVNRAKLELGQKSNEIFIAKEQLKIEEIKVENERQRISQIISKAKENEKATEKAKLETISLKDLAQKEYEIARDASESQKDSYERKMLELDQRCKEYEVALTVIEVREQEVKEKEAELLIERKHLESQQAQLRKAIEVQKQNGNRVSTNN